MSGLTPRCSGLIVSRLRSFLFAAELDIVRQHMPTVNSEFMPDTLRWVALGVIWLFAAGLGLASVLNTWAMVEVVNATLPEKERFNPLGWWSGKTLLLHAEYRRVCPSGTLLSRQGIYFVAVVLCLTVTAPLLGFGIAYAAFIAVGGGVIAWAVYFKPGA